jgi:5S rRNA maturation endonuclease (ribonuclease M5)
MFTHQISEIERIINNNREVPIVVEGKKDRLALQKLGFSKIFEISGKRIDTVVERILSEKPKSVIILTDYDKEGVKKANQLMNFFQHHRVNVNSFARRRIQTLFKIHKIEELIHFTKFIDFMEDDYHGKTSSIYDKIFNRSRVYGRRYSREARRNRSDIRPD